MGPHAPAHVHPELFAPRCAQISNPRQIRAHDESAAVWRGLKLNPQQVVSAFCVCPTPALPHREYVKFPAKIESPGIEKSRDRDDENHAQHEHDGNLP